MFLSARNIKYSTPGLIPEGAEEASHAKMRGKNSPGRRNKSKVSGGRGEGVGAGAVLDKSEE